VPDYIFTHLNQNLILRSKYGVDIFRRYFPLFSPTTHHRELVPTPKVMSSDPLSIDAALAPTALEMAELEKKEKLKNRDLIQNPYII